MFTEVLKAAVKLFPCLLLLFCQEAEKSKDTLPPHAAAVANGTEIPLKRFYASVVRAWKDKEEGKEALEQLTENLIVEQALKARNILVDEREIDRKIDALKRKYLEETGAANSWKELLEGLGVSEEEFRAQTALLVGAEKAARKDFRIPPGEEVPSVKIRIWIKNLRDKAKIETAAEDLPEGAVAVINGEVIPIEKVGMELCERVPAARLNSLLEGLIGLTLLEQEARKRDIQISEEDAEAQMVLLRARYQDSNEYRNLKFSYEKYLELQAETLESLKGSDVFRAAVFRRKLGLSQAGAEDIKNFFQENLSRYGPKARIGHIFIRTASQGKDSLFGSSRKPEDVEKLKNLILEAFRKGKTFEEVAKKFSDDVKTKFIGGDLGYIAKTDRKFGEEFLNAVFEMKVGEQSGFLKSPVGYHIVKVTDIRGIPKLEEIRSIVEEDFVRAWYRDYRSKADVRTRTFE